MDLTVREQPTIRDVLAELGRLHPSIAPLLGNALVAVNLEYVGPDYSIDATDEIALIPPVSGGR